MRALLTVVIGLSLAACGQRNLIKDMPKWDGKFWAGDHERGSVRRADEGLEIFATDEMFSDGVWVSYSDLGCMQQQLILNCAAWKEKSRKCDRKKYSDKDVKMALKFLGY